ncbi:DNA topoisomerase 3-alpha [Striga hermonthica]|uniref:DNA topoisomerase n=1 Tax=Striga hermonthica TaxID=68872 RepID=A0A9N7N9C4_STRHE|nr:DNA topoisomerase 3-alpha [Striga hermonthica]
MLPRQLIIHCLARPCRNPMAFLLLVHMCPSSLLRHLSRFLFLVFCLIHPLEVILRFLKVSVAYPLARQEIDLRIGAFFTGFQTKLLRDAFVLDFATDNQNIFLSDGHCQFPTLGSSWRGSRKSKHMNWRSSGLYTVLIILNKALLDFIGRGHLFDYTRAVIIYEMCPQEPTATQERLHHPTIL